MPPLSVATSASTPSQTTVISIVITVAVLAYVLYRQRQMRPLRTTWVLPAILIVIGVATAAQGGQRAVGSGAGLGVLVALLALDAAGLGALRALTVHLWREGGAVMRQGSWLTIALWVVGLGIHIAVDTVAGINDSTVLLYLGVTMAAQRLVLMARAAAPARIPEGRVRAAGPT